MTNLLAKRTIVRLTAGWTEKDAIWPLWLPSTPDNLTFMLRTQEIIHRMAQMEKINTITPTIIMKNTSGSKSGCDECKGNVANCARSSRDNNCKKS